jgi:acetyl-CoA carboxylase alpha subunit
VAILFYFWRQEFKDDKAMIGVREKWRTIVYDCWTTKGYNMKPVSLEIGMANPEGYKKSLMKMAEFGVPVVTFIDTPTNISLWFWKQKENADKIEAITETYFRNVPTKFQLFVVLAKVHLVAL